MRTLAQALFLSQDATREDLNEAVDILEDNLRVTRQIYGREHPETKSLEMNLRNARMFQMLPRPGDPREADEVAPPQDGIDRDGLRDLMRSFSPRATADEIDAACDTLDPDGSGADRFMMQAIKHLTEAFDISHV